MLNGIEPRVLESLADKCFKHEFLYPSLTGANYWPGPSIHLSWQHVRVAGSEVPSLGTIFENLMPLRNALVEWATDQQLRRWNLCDERTEPVDWVAEAAVQTLVIWELRGELPKRLKWENLDLLPQRSLDSNEATDMFQLERAFDATDGFVSAGGLPDVQPLPSRALRTAKRQYKILGKRLGLQLMSRISEHYFDWYVRHTFLDWTLGRIRTREIKAGATNVGHPGDRRDRSSVSKGVKLVADLVGFRR